MRVLFALPGLHRIHRGAEVAFESVATELATLPGMQVTLMGSGSELPGRRYRFERVGCLKRERFESWPRLPLFRNECAYEELSFALKLLGVYACDGYDVTLTCSYPYVNWALRAVRSKRGRPPHVFVTQNGDWPAFSRNSEFRLFGCEGLIALNPESYARNRDRWRTSLIPNGVNPEVFTPGRGPRPAFGLTSEAPVALMVSALIPSKGVVEGIHCAARVAGLQLVVVGDGPLRDAVDRVGSELMPGRFRRMTLLPGRMPEIYRCADVVLHMSHQESFGNVYVEGLATGLPVVAHDSPTTRWILEDQGVLVDCSDHEAVAAGIRLALELRSPDQQDRRRRLAVRRFTWRAIAGQYREFLEEVSHRGARIS